MIALVLLAVLAALLVCCVGLTAFVARRAEIAVPPPGCFVEVDGVRLHYVDQGAGPVILMIHGLGSQLQTFTYALAARLCHRYRLVMVDRPGAGYSRTAPAATLTAQAEVLARFLTAIGVDRALVVGHSLGGAVALALALDHPARVCGLALLSPATQPQDQVPVALRALAIRSDLVRWLVGWLVVTPLSLFGSTSQIAAVFAPDPVPLDFATRAGGVLQIRPWAFRNAARDLVEAGRQLGAYAARQDQLTIPVGILFGTEDRVLAPDLHGEGLAARAKDVDLECVAGGGHMVPISAPDQSAAFIERIATRAFEGRRGG